MNLRTFITISLILVFSFSFGQTKKLKIYTDERIELLNVIQYLSDYPILNQSENLEYKKEIDLYFKDFKNHNAIVLNRKVYREFLGFDRAVNYILHYDLPKFDLNSEFDSKELKNLNAEIIKLLPISLPKNIKEQQKIADCLSSLDELIVAHQDKLEALKNHKKGLLQNLFPDPSTSSG